ncbi:MAG: hypothetical protein J0L60_01655 [Ignavibacteria bacterium]|nr:hypothetical protein [Ignavibacteria bacterium]
MKKIFTILLLLSTGLLAQGKYFAGAGYSYLTPVGELKNRFSPGYGASVFFGKDMSAKWTLSGKLEYLVFDKINEDKMNIKREYLIGTQNKSFSYPIKSLKMDLKAYGASFQADYHIFRDTWYDVKLNLGFGIYKWNFSRGSYSDSLFAPDTAGVSKLQEALQVPTLDQDDWSGTFNVGAEFGVQIVDPLWFSISAGYKNILGELWSTLKLDFENVASMQMIDIKATLRARF